ncbi:hypothetical protein M231_01829 [Tremella mesenterica]|uniref:Nudix hydrolase domain-containing protein n=1 Tax=Tremella mesenterica TaxID=5217 RepID=A0A4Q1BSG9_TREME|nr:hypothetical protein M231_01829 [Tremella mesenterica]
MTYSYLSQVIPAEILKALPQEARLCVDNLRSHRASPNSGYDPIRQAAVLVAVFVKPGREDLSVLLTTRAKTLRRNPNQTALPGGKVDPEDPSPFHTAVCFFS